VDIGDSAGSAYLLHTAPLRPGDSGGPLYAQDSGQVIGMDVSLLSSTPGRQAHQANLSLPMPVVWTIAARLLARLHAHPGS